MDALKKFCEVIRVRRVNADFTNTSCFLCGSNFKGYDALQSHLLADHKIVLPPFDDIEAIDAFLDEIEALVVLGADGYKCLRTGKVFASLSELEAHLAATAVAGASIANVEGRKDDLRFWTWDTLPAALTAQYRFFTPDANDVEDDAEEEAINNTTEGAFVPMGDDEIAIEGTRVVEEGCGSCRIECPYCVGGADSCRRYENDDFTAHLLSAHKIDNFGKMLKAFRREDEADDEVPDFHTLIRIINMIREKTDSNTTPFSNKTVDAEASLVSALNEELEAVCGSSSSTPTAAQLASVYVVSPAEFTKMLADAPNEDFYLLPKRMNDSLITYLLHTDDDDGEDEGEEDVPMVPTLRESAAKQQNSAGAAANNDNDSSSDDE